MRAVVYNKVLYGGEHLVDSFHSDVSDYPWVLDYVSQTIFHQLIVAHFT